jgi:hypothetical protein
MWEHFMTKPLVDQGIFRRLGDCPTPWPCFVIAVREEVLEQHAAEILEILKIINKKTRAFKNLPNIDGILASRYKLKISDIQEWLSLTHWSQNQLQEEVLNKVQNQLLDLSLINKKGTFAEMVRTV